MCRLPFECLGAFARTPLVQQALRFIAHGLAAGLCRRKREQDRRHRPTCFPSVLHEPCFCLYRHTNPQLSWRYTS
jgi:hypothetical protein